MSPAVFAHGHLRLYLLSLLAERDMHGYELIQALSDRFGGTYVPSAGTIYPRLAKLEAEGLVTKAADGRKTVYAITSAGREELDAREEELDGIETELSDSVRRLADEVRSSVNDAMRSLRADLASAAREAREEGRAERRRGASPEPASASTPGYEQRAASEDSRVASRMLLHEAELLIGDFRQQLRADLRRQAASARLERETVALLRERLEAVRREVTESLSSR